MAATHYAIRNTEYAMPPKQTIRDIDVAGKRVLVRVDFNVPMDKATGAISDDNRIRAALPTIQYLRERGARAILASHLGRPDGKVVESMRLAPVAERLSELLGAPVQTVRESVGPEVEAAVAGLKDGDVLMLENVRFHAEEEANDADFARRLAAPADVYVNDAFGTAHRAHASTEGVARHLPAVAGLLMEKELDYLGRAVGDPERPFAAIIGGAKISGKIDVLKNLLGTADLILIGGGMANTFFKAQGREVGDSLVEDDQLDVASAVLRDAQGAGTRVELPVDAVIADAFDANASARTVPIDEGVPAGWRIMDIGPETLRRYTAALRDSKTVVWNGPMGVFEFPKFAEGTLGLARAVAALDAVTVVGGGETAAAVEQAGVAEQITHVSTGGGASLEFLEGKTLPGVAALKDK
jgi:phosphoglycerate kinase